MGKGKGFLLRSNFKICFSYIIVLAVSHIIDWLGAFSNLLKTLRVTSSSKHKRTILTVVKDWSRYLVAIMMALLETTSSVASVILTRLLMSGDVERNPGPGRYPGE